MAVPSCSEVPAPQSAVGTVQFVQELYVWEVDGWYVVPVQLVHAALAVALPAVKNVPSPQ
jgi:hypothetical protein